MILDRQTAALLNELNTQAAGADDALGRMGVEDARENSRAIWRRYAGEPDGACLTRDLLAGDGPGRIPARLYSPPDSGQQLLPLVVFMHGGGWAMGDLDSYDGLLRSLCVGSGARLLSVDYRLSPEHKYPAGLEDTISAIEWASANARQLGVDAARVAVMGDSAGGNLAAVAALRLHRERRVELQAQLLLYPVLDVSKPHSAWPSRMKFGDGEYLLTRDSIDVTLQWYLNSNSRAEDAEVSPLRADDLQLLPPTVVVTAGYDPLRDEAEHYVTRLQAAGVPARLKCFDETIHTFLSFGVLDVARRGRAYVAEEIKQHLF